MMTSLAWQLSAVAAAAAALAVLSAAPSLCFERFDTDELYRAPWPAALDSAAVSPASGHVFFSDPINDAIRVWSPEAPEEGAALFAGPAGGPRGIAFDADARLYVCESVAGRLVRYGVGGGAEGEEAEALLEGLERPEDVAVDSRRGVVYVSDARCVRRYNLTDGTAACLIEDGLEAPRGLLLRGGGDGMEALLVADSNGNEYDDHTGELARVHDELAAVLAADRPPTEEELAEEDLLMQSPSTGRPVDSFIEPRYPKSREVWSYLPDNLARVREHVYGFSFGRGPDGLCGAPGSSAVFFAAAGVQHLRYASRQEGMLVRPGLHVLHGTHGALGLVDIAEDLVKGCAVAPDREEDGTDTVYVTAGAALYRVRVNTPEMLAAWEAEEEYDPDAWVDPVEYAQYPPPRHADDPNMDLGEGHEGGETPEWEDVWKDHVHDPEFDFPDADDGWDGDIHEMDAVPGEDVDHPAVHKHTEL